ncbi:hypothetical protein C1H46_028668 [Malus baccata]|uniref:Uncharacterized protein n=1 Tax=Malus baccata TaxID=106549 RepID=A0A540LHF8_MALBA|nr:hypothetical protein C1H46_028668 [Malus baccata]
MAFAHYPTSIRLQASKHPKTSILKPPHPSPSFSSLPLPLKPRNLSLFSRPRIPGHKGNYTSPPSAQAEPQGPQVSSAADAFTNFKHLLLPITDGNPYLSEGTRQAIATVAALAKKYGSDITVVGGFQEYKLLERLGEGNKPTAIIGEVADDLNLDLVVISMEAIHSKHIDANLLAEFIPCPVILLPL